MSAEIQDGYANLDLKWTCIRGRNLKPNSWDDDSENPSHFNVQYFFTLEHSQGDRLSVSDHQALYFLIREKWSLQMPPGYRTNIWDDNDSFSIDESIAVAAASYRYKYDRNMEELRILTKQTWFRFYDVIPYLVLCKYPWTRYFGVLQLLVSFFACLSCLISPRGRTTGRRKVYVICRGRNMTTLYKVCEFLNKLRDTSFFGSSLLYFPETDHPITINSAGIR